MKSKLPQRRKSAEEIARLREDLGVPGERGKPEAGPPPSRPENEKLPPAQSDRSAKSEIPRAETPVPPPVTNADVTPALDGPTPAEVRLDAPASSVRESKPGATKLPAPMPPPEKLPSPVEVAGRGKPVRSLKRSERMPAPARPEEGRRPRGDSNLPDHRHDDRELQRIRAVNAMKVQPPVEQIKSLAAHPALVVLGYLLAFAGGVGGLMIALYLFLKKPRSHYHAAFITIIAMLVLVFGILYFIPQPDAP